MCGNGAMIGMETTRSHRRPIRVVPTLDQAVFEEGDAGIPLHEDAAQPADISTILATAAPKSASASHDQSMVEG